MTVATPYERYLPYRRTVETGFWIAACLLQGALGSVTSLLDLRRAGLAHPAWQPVVWEFSSVLVVLALIPAVIAFERRVPLAWDSLRRALPWHAAASAVFSVAHVAGMVALRQAAYAVAGAAYDFGDLRAGLFYEYLKDVRSYSLIVSTVLVYRFVLLRFQGEARMFAAPDEGPALEPVERPQRFLVRKLRKEFLVAAVDVDWLQAQGNYVALRVRGHDYLIRQTLSEIETRLDPARFARVHRSWIVNLDRIAEIDPQEDGDARLRMRDGGTVPCSRRYRAALKAAA